jgi:TonB family protein
MKLLVPFAFLFSLMASCMSVGAIPRRELYMPPPSQERKNQDADEDRVYTAKEVDVKAKITNRMENLPEAGRDCPREGLVRLRIILHKSGKVTEVTIIKGMGCSYDEATVEVARKFKFTPAVKDGEPVSQYQIFEYRYQ